MKEYVAEYIVPVVPADEKGKNLKFDFMNAKRLIRCKDCKHHGEQYGNGYCMKDGCYGWCDEDYCSRAERKETS